MRHNYTIGFDAKSANAEQGGVGSYGRFIINALATACSDDAYLRMYLSKRLPNAEYDSLDAMSNVESMEPDGSLWRKLSFWWQWVRISKDAHRGDVELFHSLTGRLPFGLSRYDIRSVVSIHDLNYAHYPKHTTIFERTLRSIEMASACRRADLVIAASEATKRDIAHILGINHEKIEVVYEGCNPIYHDEITEQQVEEVRLKYELPKRYLLTVGDMEERKNFGLIVDAMAELSDDVELVVVGRATSYTKRMKRRIKTLGLEERVHFLRNVPLEDRPAIYKGAEIFVQPSIYEGFSVEILEALSVGVPVIATRGSSHEEAGGDGSIYVSSKDCGELAEAIERLRGEPLLALQMVERGYQHVKLFRSEVAAYNLLKSYRRIGITLAE